MQSQSRLPAESFKLISFCPLCNKHYNPTRAFVLETEGTNHLVYVQCEHCSSSIVALVVAGTLGVSSLGLVTDLSPDDVLRFKDTPKLSADDVLELHKWIRSTNFAIKEEDKYVAKS